MQGRLGLDEITQRNLIEIYKKKVIIIYFISVSKYKAYFYWAQELIKLSNQDNDKVK